MDYGFTERRKSRNDKRAKVRFNKYRKGGKNRSANVNRLNSINNGGF